MANLHVDIEVVRTRLLRRREELRARASSARADLRHESDPLSADSAEQVTQRENDDVLGAISHSAREELARLDAALRRLAQGRYTTCAQCGEDIEEERLAAVETAMALERGAVERPVPQVAKAKPVAPGTSGSAWPPGAMARLRKRG